MGRLGSFASALLLPGLALAQPTFATTAPAPAVRADSGTVRSTARITGGETTSLVAIIATRGVDSLLPRLRAAATDTAVVVRKATRRCGPQRACPAGWDVAAVGVRVATSVIPGGMEIPVHVGFTNRGARPSPAAEGKVCWTDAWAGAQCGDFRTFEVPALASLDTVWVPVTLPELRSHDIDPKRVGAVFDPESVTGESKRDNNVALSGELQVEQHGVLEWASWNAGLADDGVVVRFEARNAARIAPVTRAKFTVLADGYCNDGTPIKRNASVHIDDLPARVGVTFATRIPLSRAQVATLRSGRCTLSAVHMQQSEGGDNAHHPPSNYFITGDQIVGRAGGR